jgi:histidinol-phosphate phosphatase family protein
MTAPRERAVFLDKDGTLIENVPYNVDPAFVVLTTGAATALRCLVDRGFRLIVVSNQPGVADGRFAAGELCAVEQRIQSLLAPAGVSIDAFYYCTHAPDQHCGCRKPAPGLVRRAAAEHGIDPRRSWLIGDILDDVEAGRRAGCRAALLVNGNETVWQRGRYRRPDVAGRSFADVVRAIIAKESPPPRPQQEIRHGAELAGRH